MPSTACWSWDARVMSASLDPEWGRGCCAHVPDPCTTVPRAATEEHAVGLAGPAGGERVDLLRVAGEDGGDPALAPHVRACPQLHQPLGELEEGGQPLP